MIDRVEINLLPAEYRVHKRGIRISRDVFYPLFFFLLLAAFLFSLTLGLRTEIQQRKNEIAAVDAMIKANSYIKEQIAKLKADRAVIQEKIRALERINVNREKWVRLMEIFCQRLPDFTWIVSIVERTQTPPVLAVEGRTLSFPEVANFMTQLLGSNYIRSVDLSSIEGINESVKMFRFGISCTINPDAQLEGEKKDTVAVSGVAKGKP
ncbi:MAG TPA: PilN domain-containing protein [Chitinivibrionales bacterium]|nr:PilN domain-containing protein [Chitinivibrionales bacterium]